MHEPANDQKFVQLIVGKSLRHKLAYMSNISPADVRGTTYEWVPGKSVPLTGNILKITDLSDREPNFSLPFNITGGNATWILPESTGSSDDSSTTPTNIPVSSPSQTPEPSPNGLSSGVKTGIGIGAAVVAIIVSLLIYLWYRNKREKARVGDQPMRTMSTDNSPQNSPSSNRYHGVGNTTPTRPPPAARKARSRSHTVGSNGSASPFRRLFHLGEKEEPLDQVSTGSTFVSYGDAEKGYALQQTSPQERSTTWDDGFPTPENNHTSTMGSELDAAQQSRRSSRYGSLRREPESPTPQRRIVSAPVMLERSTGHNTSPTYPPQQWELSANTPAIQHAQAARSPQELSSTPVVGSPSLQGSANPYEHITFGNSDDPDAIVRHLATQREKVRAERERLARMKALEEEEEEIDRRMREAQERRLG